MVRVSTKFNLALLGCLFGIVVGAKLPDEINLENRVHDHKLSEEPHYTDLDHDNKFEHNKEYDHDAFLGSDEADKFRTLTAEQSKEKLSQIVTKKIDLDQDSYVTLDELYNWLKNVTRNTILKEVDSRWETFKLNDNLDAYISSYYGALDSWSEEEKETRKDDYKTYLKLMARDKKRFKAADYDNDGKLNKNEFADFLHPEESRAMRDIVIDETLEDLDKNGDKVVSIEEFIGDLNRQENANGIEPDWLKQERENFKLIRDKNNDNVLDREEIGNWILPADYDHSLNEAKHLIFEADEDKDGKLSKDEILDKYSLFVASQATSYGQAIYEKEDL